ncbi:MAG: ribosome recycling factor [Clostridia bacterium]|nr:ribosome recycling factor [Clostridia bacterium]
MNQIFDKANEKMGKTISVFESQLASIRAGRANVNILDRVEIDYYGTPTPVKQVAAISVSENRILNIQPWDASMISEIEKAINIADIGINPQNDGKTIRLIFPPLTEERRKKLTKEVSQMAEDSKISIRSIRRECIDDLKKLEKNSEISEDELKKGEDKLQKITDNFTDKIDELNSEKQKEIMEI